jgi:D-galactonate transporter
MRRAEERVYLRVARRVVAPLILAYIIAYLDRVNIGFAKLQMLQDLHFSQTTYGFGAGIFFIGYFLFGPAGNFLLYRVGARRWLAAIMVLWGFVSAGMVFVETPLEFHILRFCLGVAESGFFPGVIYYLTRWYPAKHRAKATALFMSGVPISGAVGGPLSGWIMQMLDARGGWAGWQWLFLLEALPAVLMGLYLFLRLDDRPEVASWLSPAEKLLLSNAVSADSRVSLKGSLAEVVRDGRVWLVSLIYFCAVSGLYGIAFWLPTIVSEMGIQSPGEVGLLTSIPYAVAAVGMVLTARSADRHKEQRWHVAVPAATGALALMGSMLLTHQLPAAIVALSVAAWGLLTAPTLVWSIPTSYLRGAAAAVGIGMINSFGNLAGFASPYAVGWIKDRTASTAAGMCAVATVALLGAFLVVLGVRQRDPESP